MLSKLCKLDCLSFLAKLFTLLTWVQSCPLIEKFLYLCTRQYLSSIAEQRGSYVNKRDFSDGLLVHEPKSKPGSCWYVNRSPSFNDAARFFLHFLQQLGSKLKSNLWYTCTVYLHTLLYIFLLSRNGTLLPKSCYYSIFMCALVHE